VTGPIAYTYEADHHCPACARARFGADEHGFPPESARDGEGNPVGAVFSWDEWQNIGEGSQTLACGTCGAILDEYEENAGDAVETHEQDGYSRMFSVGSVVFWSKYAGVVATESEFGQIDRPAVDVIADNGRTCHRGQYTGPSIEYGESESILRDAALCVAYEFASYAVDPDEWVSMMVGGREMTAEDFRRDAAWIAAADAFASELQPEAERLSNLFNRC
jgi:hypothetical protein